jgi:hypothetical protein
MLQVCGVLIKGANKNNLNELITINQIIVISKIIPPK